MKFVIAKTTLVTFKDMANELDDSMRTMEGKTIASYIATSDAKLEKFLLKDSEKFKYHSITLDDEGNYVFETSDELAIKAFNIVCNLFIRVAPLVFGLLAVMKGFQKEVKKLEGVYSTLKNPAPTPNPAVKVVVAKKKVVAK